MGSSRARLWRKRMRKRRTGEEKIATMMVGGMSTLTVYPMETWVTADGDDDDDEERWCPPVSESHYIN